MKKTIYTLTQGHFTASGTGDEWKVGEYTRKADAIRKMKAISKDVQGLCGKTKGGYLLTSVWVYDEDNADNDKCIDAVEYHY